MTEIIIHTDGGARGNPGPAGAGATLVDAKGKTVAEVSQYLGEMTNNQAEYHALLLALEEAKRLGATSLRIHMDSELIVRQIGGQYRVKNEGLKPLYLKAMALLRGFGSYAMNHVRREENKRADKLANLAMDEQAG